MSHKSYHACTYLGNEYPICCQCIHKRLYMSVVNSRPHSLLFFAECMAGDVNLFFNDPDDNCLAEIEIMIAGTYMVRHGKHSMLVVENRNQSFSL